jgi:two-component system cell cycle sensor histidine kinase/response regulator CckA
MGRPDLIHTSSSEAKWKAWLNGIPLRAKLISTFLILSALTISVLAFVSNRTTTRTLNEVIGEKLHSLATSKAYAVGDLLIEQINAVEALSIGTAMHDAVVAGNNRYTGDAAAIQAQMEALDHQWITADDDDPLIQGVLNNALADELRLFQARFPDHVEVFVTDRYGALLAATNRTTDYYRADETWWQATCQHGQSTIHLAEPELDDSTDILGLHIAVPIYAQDQTTVIGVLTTIYHTTALNPILMPTHDAPPGLWVVLCLPDGQCLLPEGDQITVLPSTAWATIPPTTHTSYTTFVFENVTHLVSQADVATFTEQPAIAALGWRVSAQQELQGALAPIDTHRQTTALAAGAMGLIAAGLATVLASWLVRPVQHLTQAAQQIVAGDLNVQAAIETHDEIGTLAATFNVMTRRLRHTFNGLEQQLQELRAAHAKLQTREQELRESENRFRTLSESATLGIYIIQDSRFQYVNPAMTNIFGYTDEELLHMATSLVLIHPEDQPFVAESLRRRIEGEEDTAHYVVRGIRKDGAMLNVEILGRRIEHDGHPAVMGNLMDITAQVRAAEEREKLLEQIQESAERIHQIMNTVPEGVLLLDTDLSILLLNPIADTYLAALTGDTEPDHNHPLTHLGGRPVGELLTSPPHGLWHEVTVKRQHFQIAARAVETSPMMEGWVMVLRDITQEYENQLNIQRQERLAGIGQIASGIAHDFNNIIAVIMLYSQMSLRQPDLPDKIRERLMIIAEQGQRASELINQILDFSRSSVLDLRPLDMLPMLKETVKLWQRILPEDIRVELNYQTDTYTINADPTRIQQVLMNLAVNARDAMPNGGTLSIDLIRLHVSNRATAPLVDLNPGEWIRVSIADTGYGIPDDVLPYIFEPFFTTKAPGKGAGLGLAQVYSIVTHHQGHVDVHTQVGAGTVFSLYLPALHVSHQLDDATLQEILPMGHKETILVVEDNLATRDALCSSLEMLNYRTLEAANGKEALDLFAQHRTDIALVLTDLVMPVMGGKALAQALYQQAPDLNIVVMSGHPLDPETGVRITESVRVWIHKPPSLERLAETLAEVLQGQAVSS